MNLDGHLCGEPFALTLKGLGLHLDSKNIYEAHTLFGVDMKEKVVRGY